MKDILANIEDASDVLMRINLYAGDKEHYVHFFQYWNNAISLMYFRYTTQRYRALSPISINNRDIQR